MSLPLGSSVVTDADLPSDPPSPAELARLREKLADAFAIVARPAARRGLRRRRQRELAAAPRRRRCSASRRWRAGCEVLVARPADEVALALGLHAERARLLPAGLLLLDAAARALGAPLQLAGGGLREGVVLEQLARARARRRDGAIFTRR